MNAVAKVVPLCIAACEAEAVAYGFPPEAGRDLYQGCINDELDSWTEEEFIQWTFEMEDKWAVNGKTALDVVELYTQVNLILGQYTEVIKQAKEEDEAKNA